MLYHSKHYLFSYKVENKFINWTSEKVGFKFSEKVLVALKCVYYLPVSPDDPSVGSYLEQVWQTACHTNRQH